MKRYVLDTSILLCLIRGNDLSNKLIDEFNLDGDDATLILSVVSVGEIHVLSLNNNWGAKKRNKMLKLIEHFPIIDINRTDQELIDTYAKMDLYSQNNLPGKKLPKEQSAWTMGKNDLWIAATACVTNSELITTDKDFNNLDVEFITVHYRPPN